MQLLMAINHHDDLTSFVTLPGNTATRMGSHYSQFSSSVQARAAEHNIHKEQRHTQRHIQYIPLHFTSHQTTPYSTTSHFTPFYSKKISRQDTRHKTQDTDIYAFYRLKYSITKETM